MTTELARLSALLESWENLARGDLNSSTPPRAISTKQLISTYVMPGMTALDPLLLLVTLARKILLLEGQGAIVGSRQRNLPQETFGKRGCVFIAFRNNCTKYSLKVNTSRSEFQ